MRTALIFSAHAACAFLLAGCYPAPALIPAPEPQPGATTLLPFAGEQELAEFDRELTRQIRRHERRLRRAPPPPPPPPAPAPPGGESITNVQHQGVDEGGIVKVHGDHLVVLRRGRLFTIRIGGNELRPVAVVDAFAPGIDPEWSWYDELLVSGDNVVVIGYSYERGGTELGIFRIGADGSLAHRATYHLRSGDYFSAKNYATRLIGDRLVFYTPVVVEKSLRASLPGIRRWDGGRGAWTHTATANRIYRPAGDLSVEEGVRLHTVSTCELAGAEPRCESTAFLGPPSRDFYVSRDAVYVWATHHRGWYDDGEERPAPSILYRLPLDGAAPTALRVAGRPLSQFSFLESPDGHINVLTRTDASGRELWGERYDPEGFALLRVPISTLADGSRAAPAEAYRLLPGVKGYAEQNRFVGDWLLYGAGSGWSRTGPGPHAAFAVRWADGGPVAEIPLPHAVDRVEAMGRGALLVGGDGQALHFTSLALEPAAVQVADRFSRPDASQGETRSHGYFYLPDGDDTGVLGLPLRGPAPPGYEFLRRGSVSMAFLRNRALRLEGLGELDARPQPELDHCRASCIDWYGNARPIFLRGRILALMGYEIVEGAMEDGRIRELRRVSFLPPGPAVDVTGEWAFTEWISSADDAYSCTTRGTMQLEQREASVAMRYRQKAQCTIEGARSSTDSEGSGRGTLDASALALEVDDCTYRGVLENLGQINGVLECRVRLPSGAETTVTGRWFAARPAAP